MIIERNVSYLVHKFLNVRLATGGGATTKSFLNIIDNKHNFSYQKNNSTNRDLLLFLDFRMLSAVVPIF